VSEVSGIEQGGAIMQAVESMDDSRDADAVTDRSQSRGPDWCGSGKKGHI
jgi:hypothetical protein